MSYLAHRQTLTYKQITPDGLVVEHLLGAREVIGSITGRVYVEIHTKYFGNGTWCFPLPDYIDQSTTMPSRETWLNYD